MERLPATIFVRVTVPGYHQWSDAPNHRVYLRNTHRHLFHIEARCSVKHDDREIEFHDLLDEVRSICKVNFPDGEMRGASCERIAGIIAESLVALNRRSFIVSVSEDGECGATVLRSPEGEAVNPLLLQ